MKEICESAFEEVTMATGYNGFRFPANYSKKITNVGKKAFKGCAWLDDELFCNLFPVKATSVRINNTPVNSIDFASSSLKFDSESFAGSGLINHLGFENYGGFNGTINDAFSATAIKAVSLPSGSKEINKNAFKNCGELVTVLITDGVTEIKDNAFYGCSELAECKLPSGLTTIGTGAFQNAEAYLSIVIPNTVTSIGQDAFSRTQTAVSRIIKILPLEEPNVDSKVSSVIKSFVYNESTKENDATSPISAASFGTGDEVYVPMGLRGKYLSADGETHLYKWAIPAANLYTYGVANNLETGDVIYNGPFKYVVINTWTPKYAAGAPESPQVKLAGVCQWSECTPKTGSDKVKNSDFDFTTNKGNKGSKYTSIFSGYELNIPLTVVREGENKGDDNGFVYYTVAEVDDGAFATPTLPTDAKNFDNLYALKKNVKTVKIQADKLDLANVFADFEVLTDVEFGKIVTDNTNGWIGAAAFKPEKVTLGDNAFKNCPLLANFNADGTVRYGSEIGTSAFDGDKALKTFNITSGVTDILSNAFYGTSLTEIHIPMSVKRIKSKAFSAKLNAENKIDGVADIYMEWTSESDYKSLSPTAFESALSYKNGTETVYVPRKVHIPAGTSAFYKAKNSAKSFPHNFYNTDMFTLGEAISFSKVKDEIGRLDVVIDDDNNRTLTVEDKNDIYELGVPTADPELIVKYVRTFSTSAYQAWFVPFALTTDEEKMGAKFYKIVDTEIELDAEGNQITDDDGNPVTGLEISEEKGTIKANVPYIVAPAAADLGKEVIFTVTGIKATTEGNYFTVSDIRSKYTIHGNYEYVWSGITEGENPQPENPFYALYQGGFRSAAADATLKACRIYMTTDNPERPNPYIKFHILSDEDITAIENVNANKANSAMFDLQGRQIAAPAKGQVYIQNGVKKLAR